MLRRILRDMEIRFKIDTARNPQRSASAKIQWRLADSLGDEQLLTPSQPRGFLQNRSQIRIRRPRFFP